MRFLLSFLACIAVAACHGPAALQTNVADQANDAVIESQMENAQDAVDDEIANDAANEEAKEANAS